MKKHITALFVLLSIFMAGSALSAPLATLPRWAEGDDRTPAAFNAIWTSIENAVNNISEAQIDTGAVTESKIGSGAVTQAKMNCSGYWDLLTFCEGQEDLADTAHRHSAAYIVFSDSGFTAVTVEDAISEISEYVGYSSASVATSTYGVGRFAGYAYDGTSTTVGAASWGSASVTVPANYASQALRVSLAGVFDSGTPPSDGYLGLRVKIGSDPTIDLSSSGSPDNRFHIVFSDGSAGGGGTFSTERTMMINTTTVPSFDPTQEIVVSAGVSWNAGNPMTLSGVSVSVEGY